jgi:predicted dehydrogenase
MDIELNKAVEGAKNTGWNNGFLAFATEIVKALKEEKTKVENAATFEDGYKIQLALDAARESNRTRCAVEIGSN